MPEISEFLDSTPLLHDFAALRARAEEEGYLFFRSFLPPDDLVPVRRALLNVVDDFGWLAPSADPLEGRIRLDALNSVPEDEMRLDIGVSEEAYKAAQRLEVVHRLPHHPRLLEFFRQFFQDEVLVHPRHIVRMITGYQGMVPTPPHQDFPLIQGTPSTWTCWIPIGACPRDHGGLTVLRASHQRGYLPVKPSRGAGSIAVPLCPGETEWMSTGYGWGDVLMFPSFTLHRGLAAKTKDIVRFSFDVRYQGVSNPVESASLRPHCPLSWDEIYEGWSSQELQRYWENLPLTFSDWNAALVQPGRRIC